MRAAQPPSGRTSGGLRALVPFGGGIDSIVSVEHVRQRADVALFVVSRPGDRFEAIDRPAAVSGLPVVRAGREIDQQLMRSAELGFLNGHVPVTGILSAIAVLAAVLGERDAVVMSNEWSASVPTLEHDGRPVNHQYSKSASFEAAFRAVLAADPAGLPDYFSMLRDRTELWIAEVFAGLERYHGSFRSCNRAFHLDKSLRLGHWCGQCDKCCFIDLILAPFMSAEALRAVFAADGGGSEPLAKPELAPKFRALLGAGTKPFECVGEVSECRAAVLLAARRADRAGFPLLKELAAEVAGAPGRAGRRRDRRDAPPRGRELRPGRIRLRGVMTRERPKLGWGDLRGARVGVWGFGREGQANLRKLRSLGVEPVLVDDKPAAGEAGDEHVLATADGGLDALLRCEVVVKTPGISRYGPQADRLRQAGWCWPAASGCGCRRPTGTGSSASPAPRASPPPPRSSATC